MVATPQHGRHTIIKIGTNDISAWVKSSTLEKNPDIHDVTGYGVDDKLKVGGLRDNSLSMSGWYDTTATTGTAAVLGAHSGETVTVVRQCEGAGTGKPQETMQAVIGKYAETNPVDDVVTWSCDLAISGPVTRTAQA